MSSPLTWPSCGSMRRFLAHKLLFFCRAGRIKTETTRLVIMSGGLRKWLEQQGAFVGPAVFASSLAKVAMISFPPDHDLGGMGQRYLHLQDDDELIHDQYVHDVQYSVACAAFYAPIRQMFWMGQNYYIASGPNGPIQSVFQCYYCGNFRKYDEPYQYCSRCKKARSDIDAFRLGWVAFSLQEILPRELITHMALLWLNLTIPCL